jgi:DNA-binding NtrC family response regulator
VKKELPFILVVDDEPDIRELVSEILEDEGYDVEMAENAASAREMKNQRQPQLVLLDIWMPDTDGITLLKEWVAEDKELCPVIMMSGHGSVESAVEATRLGAYDFLEKPLSLAKLLLTVERALEASYLQQENAGLKQQLMLEIEPVGKSLAIERTKEQIKRLAQHNARLLLVGEAGAGNAALFAISLLANEDEALAKKLADFREKQRQTAMNMSLPPE